jgi:hypothetical protein
MGVMTRLSLHRMSPDTAASDGPRPWIRRALAGGLCAIGASVGTAPAAETVTAAPGRLLERIVIEAGGEQRALEGVVVVEAVDGGLLVERSDERLELVQPATIRGRTPLDRAVTESPRDLGRRILGELPPGFDLHVTRHYVICFDTSRAYAQWCGALFERLHDAYMNFWRQAGFKTTPPPRPLVVVIFADRQRYEAFAARDLGAATDRVVGYYNLMTNRVTTFDLTGSATLARPAGQAAARAGLEILSRPEAAGMVATLVHEATHQMAFNAGLHQRLAPVPLWVSEGVATYFETPDLAHDRGWKGIGNVNRQRLDRFLAGQEPGWLERIVRDDEPFRRPDEALDAYAQGWALTFFLMQTRKAAFVDYLQAIAAKSPLVDDSPEDRLADFRAAFHAAPGDLEEAVLRHLSRLPPPR